MAAGKPLWQAARRAGVGMCSYVGSGFFSAAAVLISTLPLVEATKAVQSNGYLHVAGTSQG